MRMKEHIAALALGMALISEQNTNRLTPKDISGKYPTKPQPKGTKEYFFDAYGNFSNDHMLKSECVFVCYAINDKSARKKFEKFNIEQALKVSDTTKSNSSTEAQSS